MTNFHNSRHIETEYSKYNQISCLYCANDAIQLINGLLSANNDISYTYHQCNLSSNIVFLGEGVYRATYQYNCNIAIKVAKNRRNTSMNKNEATILRQNYKCFPKLLAHAIDYSCIIVQKMSKLSKSTILNNTNGIYDSICQLEYPLLKILKFKLKCNLDNINQLSANSCDKTYEKAINFLKWIKDTRPLCFTELIACWKKNGRYPSDLFKDANCGEDLFGNIVFIDVGD